MTTFKGTNGTDWILGSSAGDEIEAYFGLDTVDAGGGDDVIVDTGGSAALSGGAGNDIITFRDDASSSSIYREDPLNVVISGGSGDDHVYLGMDRGSATVDLGEGNDTVVLSSDPNSTQLTLGEGRDTVILDYYDLSIDSKTAPVVLDFVAGAGGDVLDLGKIFWLQSFSLNALSAENPFASGHLVLVQDGADTIVQMDVDGFGGGSGQGYSVDIVRLYRRRHHIPRPRHFRELRHGRNA